MPAPAELSSIADTVEDLTRRVAAIAAELDHPPSEELAADLFEVERSLRTASRRLSKVVNRAS